MTIIPLADQTDDVSNVIIVGPSRPNFIIGCTHSQTHIPSENFQILELHNSVIVFSELNKIHF